MRLLFFLLFPLLLSAQEDSISTTSILAELNREGGKIEINFPNKEKNLQVKQLYLVAWCSWDKQSTCRVHSTDGVFTLSRSGTKFQVSFSKTNGIDLYYTGTLNQARLWFYNTFKDQYE